MEISAVREVPSDDGILEVLWPTRDAVRNVPSDDGKLEVLWQTRDAVREVPSDDGILEFLWQNRDELDTEIPLTLIKVRRRISKAIRDYVRIQIKNMSRAQMQTLDKRVEKLTNGDITSWKGLIKNLRRIEEEDYIGHHRKYIIEGIYLFIIKDEHSKIIDDVPGLERIPGPLRNTLNDLLAQIKSKKASPDEKNNTNLYEKMCIIFKLMKAILGSVQNFDSDIRTGNDLFQGIIDLQNKVQQLEHLESTNLVDMEMMEVELYTLTQKYDDAQKEIKNLESCKAETQRLEASSLVETEMMKDKHVKLKQKYDDVQRNLKRIQTETQQKDSKIENLRTKTKRLSHELLGKEGEIKRLIGTHEHNIKDLNEEHHQITKKHKEDMKTIVKENKDALKQYKTTISYLMKEHKEEISKRDEMLHQFSDQLKKNKENP